MNIFVTDVNPVLAAQSQHDRHVVKMILESAQMLSTACWEIQDYMNLVESCSMPGRPALDNPTSGNPNLYKSTHRNHPCNVWVREHFTHFGWLTIHMNALVMEYHRRFPGKTHACYNMGLLFAEAYASWVNELKPKSQRMGFFTTDPHNRRLIINPAIIAETLAQVSGFVYAGPDQYYSAASVPDSYRRYYLAEKVNGNRWTNPSFRPTWLADAMLTRIHMPIANDKRTRRKVERVVANPHVPAGFGMPAFLRKPSN